MPHATTDAMTAHLAEISRHVAPGAHALLVLDGAGWHSSKSPTRNSPLAPHSLPGYIQGARCFAGCFRVFKALIVPDTITLMLLPPYSPELNPVETLWQYLRQNNLANRVFDNHDEIVDVCCTAWNSLMAMPQRLASTTLRDWAKVNG